MSTGYVFVSAEHGSFSPEGKVAMDRDQADRHNAELAAQELALFKEYGRAVLYLFGQFGSCEVGQWASKQGQRFKVLNQRQSTTNWGHTRIDVWFRIDGDLWWGVNIGDNDLVRARKIKG